MSKAKQSSVYINEELKKRMKILLIQKPDKWRTISEFINEAISEKLKREER